MTALSDSASSSPRLPSRSEFDEEGYLLLYRDIAEGVADGRIESGWAHFARSGFAEGRKWLRRPDPVADVDRGISPDDTMFRGNTEHYFEVGESALHCIEAALASARRHRLTVRRILDLPCGHGRVLRYLRRGFPDAELVACDLDRAGVDFCARRFNATPAYSDVNLAAIPLSGEFDIIWCGSLLTHLDAARSSAFLRFFRRLLGPRGILVFTVHGRHCQREMAAGENRHELDAGQIDALLRSYDSTGFAYVDYRDASGYGFSLMHPRFVVGTLIEPEWKLLGYHETGWDKRQDVIALQIGAESVGWRI